MAKISIFIALMTIALLGISAFGALSTARAVFPIPIHPVQVDLTGSMMLGWYNTSVTLSVAQNFTANVPSTLTPGEYDAKFSGFARVDESSVAFNGMIMTENGTFQAEFAVPNPGSIPTGECAAWGNVTIIVSATAVPPPIISRVIQLAGRVTGWQGANASGRLDADVAIAIAYDSTTQCKSDVHVSWSPWIPAASPMPFSNWNFSFYNARLINVTSVALNSSGSDLYIEGIWNVVNVTFSGGGNFTDFQESISYIRQNVTGDLNVYGNWTSFTVSLTGFGDVTGSVEYVRAHAARVLEGDIFGRGYVDIYDIVFVARQIGATPGAPQWGGPSNFNNVEKADVNNDFHVDIYDLVTVATEIGQSG